MVYQKLKENGHNGPSYLFKFHSKFYVYSETSNLTITGNFNNYTNDLID